MTEDKKINEMADIIDRCINGSNFDDISDAACALYTAGYRKASEVAREIFCIIDDIVESWKLETRSKETGELIRTSYNGTMIAKCIAELKKKYTQEK